MKEDACLVAAARVELAKAGTIPGLLMAEKALDRQQTDSVMQYNLLTARK